MRLVTGLVKDRLLGCMGQVLQRVLARKGARDGTRGTGNKVSSHKDWGWEDDGR